MLDVTDVQLSPYWHSSSLITCLSLAVDGYLYWKARQGVHCLSHHIRILASLGEGLVLLARAS
jgi:hypothetical protein